MKPLSIILASLIASIALVSYATEQVAVSKDAALPNNVNTEQPITHNEEAKKGPVEKQLSDKLNTLEYKAPELKKPALETPLKQTTLKY